MASSIAPLAQTSIFPYRELQHESLDLSHLPWEEVKQKIHKMAVEMIFPVLSVAFAVAGGIGAFVVSPVCLVAMIPALVYAIIGIQKVHLEAPRPPIENPPIGLANSGNNCWINSIMQILLNDPSLEQRLRASDGLFELLARAYHASQKDHRNVTEGFDTQVIRLYLHAVSNKIISRLPTHEDAGAVLEHYLSNLLSGGNKKGCLYQLTQVLTLLSGKKSVTIRNEPMISLELSGGKTLYEYLMHFFDCSDELGQKFRIFFDRPPEHLMIQCKRFYQKYDRTAHAMISHKISDPVQAPFTFELPASCSAIARAQTYECMGFNVHQGSLNGGHYIAYVKREDGWWCCNDTSARPVSLEEVQAEIQNGYCYHYRAKA